MISRDFSDFFMDPSLQGGVQILEVVRGLFGITDL